MVRNMQAGDLIFIRGKSPLGRTISFFDGEFSHVAICLSDKGSILEAEWFTKSHIVPFYFDDYEVVDLGLTDEQRDRIVHLAVDLTGKHYDYSEIVGILLNKLFKTKRWNNPNNMICSEILVYLLNQINWFDSVEDMDNMLDSTPNELYRFVQNKIK